MLHGLAQGDARALHRARVASRRLREIIPVLQLEPDTTAKLSRRLRKVTTRLGSVRELDVTLQLVDELDSAGEHDPQSLARLAAMLADERADARERLVAKLPIDELHRIADRLAKVRDQLKARDASAAPRTSASRTWRWVIDARIARRAAALRAAIADAGAVYLPDRLHTVRIAVKKVRYAVELASEVEGAKTSANLRLLKRVQEALGRMHDVQVLVDRVRQLEAEEVLPDVTARRNRDAVITSLENDCRRLHAQFMRNREDLLALCDRLSGKSAGRQSPSSRRAEAS